MTSLTITVPGNEGEQTFFYLNIKKENFFTVVDMEFETVEDVQQGEKDGLYQIEK